MLASYVRASPFERQAFAPLRTMTTEEYRRSGPACPAFDGGQDRVVGTRLEPCGLAPPLPLRRVPPPGPRLPPLRPRPGLLRGGRLPVLSPT